jgi:hypothetical protein
MDRLRNVLGLQDDGKRVYQLKEGEVAKADFEYCQVLNQILFSETGLAATLGPTWKMIHDPRFAALEKVFVIKRAGKTGGDASIGIQRQQKDGTFDGSMAGMEQISEILSEGRNMIDFLRARAIIDAASELYPDRVLRFNEKDSRSALKLVEPYTPAVKKIMADKLVAAGKLVPVADAYPNQEVVPVEDLGDGVPVSSFELPRTESNEDYDLTHLYITEFGVEEFHRLGVFTPTERIFIVNKADEYQMYKPENLKYWPDEELWKLIFAEYTNYFFRDGRPNQLAINLHKLFKGDLLGLIHDYAEVANVQETVLLSDTSELYEPAKHGEEMERVSMEVENLERGLTYRAELRTTAYQILKQLGIADRLPELTDFERDRLIQVIFTSNFMDNKAESVTDILGFLAGIQVSGQSVEEREFLQLADAAASSQKTVAGLKDGSIQPISRRTEEVVETAESTPEDAMIQRVFGNPYAMVAFSRLAGIEKRIEILSEAFSPFQKNEWGNLYEADIAGNPIPVDADRHQLLTEWVATIGGGDIDNHNLCTLIPNVSDEDMSQLNAIEKLVRAQNVLRPVFEDESFAWSDERVTELLLKVEEFDPTPEQVVTELPEGSDPGVPLKPFLVN